MGGPATITIDHPMALTAVAGEACVSAEALLQSLEQRYSRYRDDSLVAHINRRAGSGQWTPLDEEATALLQFCSTLWAQSSGLFDPTAGILRRVWDFKLGRPGDTGQLPVLLEKVGWPLVTFEGNRIHLEKQGMELDLGGIVKEYGADMVSRHLRSRGITTALVELAGDIVALGRRQTGARWRVGISDPGQPTSALLSVELENAALATSGNYQRVIEIEGTRYSHFLNPSTGWPVAGPSSVSVISDTCLTAGAVAMVACLMPPRECHAWLARAGLPWLRVDGDGQLSGPLHEAHPGGTNARN